VAATLHVHQLVEHNTEKWKSLSQAAFDKFDVDGDGYITSDELRMVCLRKLPELTQLFMHFWFFIDILLYCIILNSAEIELLIYFGWLLTCCSCLQHTGMKGSIDPLLEEADIDKDGKISLDEFRRLLKTASMSARTVQTPRGVRMS